MNIRILPVFFLSLFTIAGSAAPERSLPEAKRIIFLGDSITHSGQYIGFVETVLLAETSKHYDIIGLGLSSETVSGLSEEGHAGGRFPRPDLHERLDRVLEKTKPDLVVACYGMNCGIYLPFDEGRFQKYKDGIQWLHDKTKAAGADIIHLTPPMYDAAAARGKFPYYNDVLGAYGKWLLGQRKNGWRVVNLHAPMNEALAQRRKTDAAFAFSKDGIHPNAEGHWIMARQLLKAWGVKCDHPFADFSAPTGKLSALCELVSARQDLRNAAWLSYCGHTRPRVTQGLPIGEAEAKAQEITKQIEALLQTNAISQRPAGRPELVRDLDFQEHSDPPS